MTRLVPLTALPLPIRRPGEPHVCRFPAPQRCSERTSDGWIDREWKPGEKAEYEEKVLGRKRNGEGLLP